MLAKTFASLSLCLCHFSLGQLKSRIMVPLQIPDTCARFPYSMLSILICMQSVKVHAQSRAQVEFNFSLGQRDEKLLCLYLQIELAILISFRASSSSSFSFCAATSLETKFLARG